MRTLARNSRTLHGAPQTRISHCLRLERFYPARFLAELSCEVCAGRPYFSFPRLCWDRPSWDSLKQLPQNQTLTFLCLIFVSRRTTPRSLHWTMCFGSSPLGSTSTSPKSTLMKSRQCSMNGAAVSEQHRPLPMTRPNSSMLRLKQLPCAQLRKSNCGRKTASRLLAGSFQLT